MLFTNFYTFSSDDYSIFVFQKSQYQPCVACKRIAYKRKTVQFRITLQYFMFLIKKIAVSDWEFHQKINFVSYKRVWRIPSDTTFCFLQKKYAVMSWLVVTALNHIFCFWSQKRWSVDFTGVHANTYKSTTISEM